MNAPRPAGVWAAVAPDDFTTVWLGRGPRSGARTSAALAGIVDGTTVVVLRPAACGVRSVGRSMQRAGLLVDPALVVVPSARRPLLAIGACAESLTYATTALLAVPPRTGRLGWAWAAACRLLQSRSGAWLLRHLGPHAIIGRPS